ncbi:MAG: hypothetical protein Q4B57_03240 [Eubacteriales bacterium]|nr:hypothetical protein [Eubacteriales bacterium]
MKQLMRTAVGMLSVAALSCTFAYGAFAAEPEEPISKTAAQETFSDVAVLDLKDGEYAVNVDLLGGSGKAYVNSPTILTIQDGRAYAHLEWSSENYDYMIVDGETYFPTNTEGNSVFESIPVLVFDEEMPVIADTTAMGTPHEISYTLTFYSESIGSKSQMPQEAAKRVLLMAGIIIVGGGILNHYVKKKREH